MRYLLGIDGGGTGCRAAVCGPDGAVLGRGQAGPANVASNPAGAIANIRAAIDMTLAAAGLPLAPDQIAVGMGLAGASAEGAIPALQAALPFQRIKITTDAITAAKGALGAADGIVAAIGTGSVFVIQQEQTLRQCGGWGFTLGDEGSGARMGRDLLALVVQMIDGCREETPLLADTLRQMGGPARIIRFAASASPADFAALTPPVLIADDPAAAELRANHLQEAARMITHLQPDPALPVTFTGGLAGFYSAGLSQLWDIRPPKGTPLDGALLLAAEGT